MVRTGCFWVRIVGRFGKPVSNAGLGHILETHKFWWPLELGIRTHEPTKLCGPSSWGYGEYVSVPGSRWVRRAKFSHALMWPFELGLRTPTLRCGHLSGPSRTRRRFFDFELGSHDGAYKGRVHVIVLFVGRKNGNLIDRQQSYTRCACA